LTNPSSQNHASSRHALETWTGTSHASIAPAVGGLFFPQSKSLGIDRSRFSPALQAKITFAGVNNTSYAQAEQDLDVLAELTVSDKEVRRLCKKIGEERVAERDAAVAAYQARPLPERKGVPEGVTAPDVAVVGVDGGRLQILERTAHGAAVIPETPEEIQDDVAVPEAETKAKKPLYWREDKIGLLLTMTSECQKADPCPEIPDSFVNAQWIGELAKELGKRASPKEEDKSAEPPGAGAAAEKKAEWQPPKVATKQLVATRRPWANFGPLLAAWAWSVGFFGADRKAFLGDGADNNWTLWRNYFSSFVPILDFIHALTYVFHSALAGRSFADGWLVYDRWIRWVWSGEVERVIAELATRQAELGAPSSDAKETSPAKVVSRALGYLQNNKDRMRYAEYRREGLPIVSSYVESAVKQFNYRVKGTEKFWREEGAEEILQLRADYLSDANPMDEFWKRRQAGEPGQARYKAVG
jgi:hypothetical protein